MLVVVVWILTAPRPTLCGVDPAMPMQRSAVAAYRQLLVAQRNLFMNDLAGMMAARAETRRRFLEHASAPPEQVDSLVAEAIDAAGFIEDNVAQTIRNERGNYG